MTKQVLTAEQLKLKEALEEFYGAAIPDDVIVQQTSIEENYQILPLFSDEIVLITYPGSEGEEMQIITVTQRDNPFYGQDIEDQALSDKGYEETIELVNERYDENGNIEYYQSGRTRHWVHPTYKPKPAA